MQNNANPYITTWTPAPEYRVPVDPALLAASTSLWLAYPTTAEPNGEMYAVVRFNHVIDHRLSPINDEGIGKHPYARLGLKWHTFNEIVNSAEASEWRVLGARHWVVTFKDNTLDVIAENAEVLIEAIPGDDSLSVLLSAVKPDGAPTDGDAA